MIWSAYMFLSGEGLNQQAASVPPDQPDITAPGSLKEGVLKYEIVDPIKEEAEAMDQIWKNKVFTY